ncbi:hypothetical protein SCHIN_v1c01090 [Spiroplasma chinense]|uniref:Rhodanese domain-containing protein n=1 Tax=Spiroplasma chinense TaxID=216932 RepID=A0A5B9Y4X9_9MOLU|nr:rhodanese-like domain-containing protein [Spiroplasma chinense]QEH61307.1 hypothetical protein SCHIN_v1c01090 [Spiroplasma chinense]
MQWLEYVFKLIDTLFKSNSFKKRFKTKSERKLFKILKSNKWQVIDLRNKLSYEEHHIEGTINIPHTSFSFNYYRKMDKKKKTLILNQNYRSNLDIYRTLKRKGFKTYLLYANYPALMEKPEVDRISKVVIY